MGKGKERLNAMPSRSKLRALRMRNETKMKARNAKIAMAAAVAERKRAAADVEEDLELEEALEKNDQETGGASGSPREMLDGHSDAELLQIADEHKVNHTDMDRPTLIDAILKAAGYTEAAA